MLTSQMQAAAANGQNRNQEPEAPSESLLWVTDAQVVQSLPVASKCVHQQEVGSATSTFNTETRHCDTYV